MWPIRTRLRAPLLAVPTLAAILTVTAVAAQQEAAALYPGALQSETFLRISTDARGSGLALPRGAQLAPPKILELGSDPVGISRVVEDQGGSERREDTGTEVKFELQAEVLFAKDSARLSDSAKSRITSIAREIRQLSATKVRVFGFTDNLGSSVHGNVLSKQRADAVGAVLADELRHMAVTFETRGFGEQRPVASNATEAGRQKNRRVEISFSRAGG